MIIRILPSLETSQQWIDFCRREVPYCFVQEPDTLVDLQTSHLIITLLNRQVRNGKEAVKYSIGSRQSVKPAWEFIKACNFSLSYMVEGLKDTRFDGNVRDNSFLRRTPDITVRKFFGKEQAIISPSLLGPLDPLSKAPAHWTIHDCCRLLANAQTQDLRAEQRHLQNEADIPADPQQLLLQLISQPEHWRVHLRNGRLWLLHGKVCEFSLIPSLNKEMPQALGAPITRETPAGRDPVTSAQ